MRETRRNLNALSVSGWRSWPNETGNPPQPALLGHDAWRCCAGHHATAPPMTGTASKIPDNSLGIRRTLWAKHGSSKGWQNDEWKTSMDVDGANLAQGCPSS